MILQSLWEWHLYWGDITLQHPMAANRDAKSLVGRTVFGFAAPAGLEEGLRVVLASVSASKQLQNLGQDQGKFWFFIHTSILGCSKKFSKGGVSKKISSRPFDISASAIRIPALPMSNQKNRRRSYLSDGWTSERARFVQPSHNSVHLRIWQLTAFWISAIIKQPCLNRGTGKQTEGARLP